MILRQAHFHLLKLLEIPKVDDTLKFFHINIKDKTITVDNGKMKAVAKWECLGESKFKNDFKISYENMKILKSFAYAGHQITLEPSNNLKCNAIVGDLIKLEFLLT